MLLVFVVADYWLCIALALQRRRISLHTIRKDMNSRKMWSSMGSSYSPLSLFDTVQSHQTVPDVLAPSQPCRGAQKT
ncbi:hypothetical protein BKA63DRAFT_137226 [Paraphoma chrysanthemicola]|nr:hypothetical protein BKA63DRAFT_137226 [Paraphoma chrysanthemicola]